SRRCMPGAWDEQTRPATAAAGPCAVERAGRRGAHDMPTSKRGATTQTRGAPGASALLGTAELGIRGRQPLALVPAAIGDRRTRARRGPLGAGCDEARRRMLSFPAETELPLPAETELPLPAEAELPLPAE